MMILNPQLMKTSIFLINRGGERAGATALCLFVSAAVDSRLYFEMSRIP